MREGERERCGKAVRGEGGGCGKLNVKDGVCVYIYMYIYVAFSSPSNSIPPPGGDRVLYPRGFV